MSDTHTITNFEGSQFRDLIEGFPCPANDGDCGQMVRFSRFEDGTAVCARCGTEMRLNVEVIDDGRDPTS